MPGCNAVNDKLAPPSALFNPVVTSESCKLVEYLPRASRRAKVGTKGEVANKKSLEQKGSCFTSAQLAGENVEDDI